MNIYRIMFVSILVTLYACVGASPVENRSHAPDPQGSADADVSASIFGAGIGLVSDVPMAFIPAGEFRMGSVKGSAKAKRSEGPQRAVHLDAYHMDVYEVTTKDYAKFIEVTQPSLAPKGWSSLDLSKHGNRPVVGVTWDDAVAYCAWVGKRLPTEAEWEKGARGTDGRQYPWGDELPTPDKATLTKKWEGYETPTPVGSLEAGKSPYGLYDMAGNAMEWVSDWYDPKYYESAPSENPQGPEGGRAGIVRGGGWGFLPADARAARRINPPRETRCTNIGFRCARGVEGDSTTDSQPPK